MQYLASFSFLVPQCWHTLPIFLPHIEQKLSPSS
nr:MAG TPA: hypothetical protein [Caudoviricetes sp.]